MLDSFYTELLLEVVSYLDEQDLLIVRQVNRRMAAAAHDAFGSTFFGSVTTDLSKASLTKLEGIVASEGLRSFVTTLQVEPWGPDDTGLRESWASECSCCDGGGLTAAVEVEQADDAVALTLPSLSLSLSPAGSGERQGQFQTLRRWVVDRLPNCRSFVVTDLLSFNQYPADDKARIHPMEAVAMVLSLIAGPEPGREPGREPEPDQQDQQRDTTEEQHSGERRGPIPVRSFRIRLKPPSRLDSPTTAARLALPLAQISRCLSTDNDRVHSSWTTLHTLELSFDPGTPTSGAFRMALSLISLSPNLESLTLACLWDSADPLLRAVADLPPPQIPQQPTPTRLRHLTLGAVTGVSEPALLSLLSRFRGDSLVSLGFYLVDVTAPSWSGVFAAVSDAFSCLESFTLHSCRQGADGKLVFFCPLLRNPSAVLLEGSGGQLELTDLIYRERKRRVCGIRYRVNAGASAAGTAAGQQKQGATTTTMANALSKISDAAYSMRSGGGEMSPGFGMAEDENGQLTFFRPSKFDFWTRA